MTGRWGWLLRGFMTAMALVLLFVGPAGAMAPPRTKGVVVRGHFRKDGTFVKPHVRKAPGAKKPKTVVVRGHFRANGTYVKPHVRRAPSSKKGAAGAAHRGH